MEIFSPASFEKTVDGRKRQRKRLSQACITCRSRKIKCDKAKPFCASCKLTGISKCIYEGSPFDSNSTHDELSRLRMENDKLKKLLSTQNTTTHTSSSHEHPSVGKQQLDMGQYSVLFHKKSRSVFYGATSFRATAEIYRKLYFDYFKHLQKEIKPSRRAWKVVKTDHLNSIYFPDGKVNLELLYSRLESFLPSHATLRLILTEFFDSVWFKFFPIIEKTDFMDHFERVISEQPDGSQKLVLTYKEADFSRIALVLLVLKLTLTFQYGGIELIDTTVFADNNDMLSEYIDKFLACARYLTRTSLPTLQTLFIIRSLKRYDPRDGDGGDTANGSIYVGLTFELALTLGLNGDIDRLYEEESVEHRTTLKNLWRSINYMDAINSYDLGVVPHISERCFIPETIDDGSLMFKTTMALQKLMRDVNAVSITLGDITGAIEHLQKFHDGNFEPVYTTLKHLHELDSGDYFPFLQKVILQTQILYVISTLYYLMLKIRGPPSWREMNFVMSIKTGLLASLAWVDLVEIVAKFETLPISSYIKNHICQLIFGLQRFFLTKFNFFNMYYFLLEYDNQKHGLYKPYTETLSGPPPKDITIKLSKWQTLEYDAKVDPFVFRDLFSINEIVNRLCLRMFRRKKLQRAVFFPYDDPSFFIQWRFLKYANDGFLSDNKLEDKAKSFKTNINIDYDVYPGDGFLNPVMEKTFEEEMNKILEWKPETEVLDEINYGNLMPGETNSFFDILLYDGGIFDWLV